MKRIWMIGFVALATVILLGQSGSAPQTQAHRIFSPSDIAWVDGPNSLPGGAKSVILEGDPSKDGTFTMRLKMPDGYTVPPHYHPKTEHVTVISGTVHIGMGEKFNKELGKAMPAGTFAYLPANMKHFAWATGETVIQLHGTGPWDIVYVNPSDDPRKGLK